MRHGYYLAYFDQLYGDEEYNKDLRSIYVALGIPEPTKENGTKESIRYNGVARYEKDGRVVTVVIVRDFFNENDGKMYHHCIEV